MAIKKTIYLDTGVFADYWKIIRMHIDLASGQIGLDLACFLNEEARRSGKNQIEFQHFAFLKDQFDFDDNLLRQAYILISQEPKFSGGEAC